MVGRQGAGWPGALCPPTVSVGRCWTPAQRSGDGGPGQLSVGTTEEPSLGRDLTSGGQSTELRAPRLTWACAYVPPTGEVPECWHLGGTLGVSSVPRIERSMKSTVIGHLQPGLHS